MTLKLKRFKTLSNIKHKRQKGITINLWGLVFTDLERVYLVGGGVNLLTVFLITEWLQQEILSKTLARGFEKAWETKHSSSLILTQLFFGK